MASALQPLLQLLPLDSLPRTGWIQAGIAAPESVAAHSLGAALIAISLGPRVEPRLDVDRAVALLVVHDVPEALTGDLPRSAAELLPPGAKADLDARAGAAAVAPLSPLAAERLAEFSAQSTREARFAKGCDRLHMGVRMLGYLAAGARGLDSFRDSIASLDATEFEPLQRLQREILANYDELD